MSTPDGSALPVVGVVAEVLPGKEDPSARAQFANGSRAGQYAQMLADSGDYACVYIEYNGERYWIGARTTERGTGS